MEHIYAVESAAELQQYQDFVSEIQPKLNAYITYLQNAFQATELPRAVLWTSERTATHLISGLPIPAFTNDYRVVMTCDLDTWRNLYLKQLDGIPQNIAAEIRDYYASQLNQHHILQILGHELVHHCNLFIDEVYDSGEGVWFEEGMAEYISRRYFLTGEEFRTEARINSALVSLYENRRSSHSLQDFGTSTYREDYASIFYEYWRSFLAVNQIVEDHNGDIIAVFHSYHQWYEGRCGQTLAQWFKIEI